MMATSHSSRLTVMDANTSSQTKASLLDLFGKQLVSMGWPEKHGGVTVTAPPAREKDRREGVAKHRV